MHLPKINGWIYKGFSFGALSKSYWFINERGVSVGMSQGFINKNGGLRNAIQRMKDSQGNGVYYER